MDLVWSQFDRAGLGQIKVTSVSEVTIMWLFINYIIIIIIIIMIIIYYGLGLRWSVSIEEDRRNSRREFSLHIALHVEFVRFAESGNFDNRKQEAQLLLRYSRSYYMNQDDRLKTRLLRYCVIYVLTLFIVIAASRTVNKNVSTDAVIRAKPGTQPGVRKLLANYQIGFDYKFRLANR